MKIPRNIGRTTVGMSLLAVAVCIASACQRSVRFTPVDQWPDIFPDYIGTTIPEEMAHGDGELFRFEMQNGDACSVDRERRGDTIWCTVSAWKRGSREGVRYKAFPIIVSGDAIDPYVTYRLIEPGYESWSNMYICQRRLTDYEERAIVSNRANERGCINCHTFDPSRAGRMLFHSRGTMGGTVLVEPTNERATQKRNESGKANPERKVQLIDFKALGARRRPTYPAWHPGGRYVAFSSNDTQQCFLLHGKRPLEVYDTESDIILYDTKLGTVTEPPILNTPDTWETFPAWSPGGRWLYYCAADSVRHAAIDRQRTHYRLMRIAFNPREGVFTGQPQEVSLGTLDMTQHSVSLPSIHGHYLLFTLTDYGTFPIWHEEADLWLLDTRTGEVRRCDELNSPCADSYHSWSSNGRWVVFGSRRLDGRYTRLFISHFDGQGHFTKPFLLPQAEPSENRLRLQSFNRPEFVRTRIDEIKSVKP